MNNNQKNNKLSTFNNTEPINVLSDSDFEKQLEVFRSMVAKELLEIGYPDWSVEHIINSYKQMIANFYKAQFQSREVALKIDDFILLINKNTTIPLNDIQAAYLERMELNNQHKYTVTEVYRKKKK